MIRAQKAVTQAAVGVAVADRPQDMTALAKPGCAAVIWRRQVPQGVQGWLNALDPGALPQGRAIVHHTDLRATLTAFCGAAGSPECAGRAALIDDAAALGARFAALMRARHLRLRLQVVTTDACRRFHIDALTARLICTYRGTGTQYGISTDGDTPARVFTVPTGSPIVLRGTLWPETPASGLLHRSPPVAGTGETRLVLVIDPVLDPGDAV